MNLGQAIAYIRKRKNLSQGSLAASLGIQQTYLSMIENGRKSPSNNLLKSIAAELQVPIFYFHFLALNEDDVANDKREAYNSIVPAVKGLVEGFFLD